MDFPVVHTIKVSSTGTAAAEDTSHIETALAIIRCTELVTADTSAPSDNNCKSLAINFSYATSSFFNHKAFAGTLALTVPIAEPSQEEAIVPITLDSAEVYAIYRSIIQRRPFSTCDLMVTDETASAPSTTPTIE